MKKHIPNTLTSLNLFSGCIGLVFAFNGELIYAGYAILISAVFDFLDGMLARLLNAYSEIGKELDSLADMVSFGVLPSVIIYQLLLQLSPEGSKLPYFAFIIAVFSALRLAKFNTDTRQTENFIGLPTPANALFMMSLPYFIAFEAFGGFFNQVWVLMFISLVMSLLLIAELPLFSLKFKNLSWANNQYRYTLILVSVVLLTFLKFAAIPLIIVAYLVLSFIQNITSKNEIQRRN